ncbi:MAG: hypothetical protein CMF54_07080 [Legionellales bacterium]|nr:hypothetical protein [Legionellales bacterium]|tara:strand:- start:6034 stop:6807 length:774 start_codon:yes stop_codon:yes gene_type:complete
MPFKIFEEKIFFSCNKIKKFLIKNKNLYFTEDYKQRNEEKNKIFLSKSDYDLDYNFLYFIAALSFQKKGFSILDFGAGVGNTYIKYRKKGFLKKNIYYSIFDQNKDLTYSAEKMIKKNFKDIKNLNIIYNFKDIKYHDAIHFGSMFEYVEDYKKLLNKIFNKMKKKPEYIFISDLFGTNQKDFYLIANYYGHKYFVKFHNLKNLIIKFKKLNYNLVYKNPHLPNIKGNFQFFDMSNLQKKYQISHTWNLFFKHDNKR